MVDEDEPECVQRPRNQAGARRPRVSRIFMRGGGHDEPATLHGSPAAHKVAIIATERGHALSPFSWIAAGRMSHGDSGVNTGDSPDARTKRFMCEIAELVAHGELVRLFMFGLRAVRYSGSVLLLVDRGALLLGVCR